MFLQMLLISAALSASPSFGASLFVPPGFGQSLESRIDAANALPLEQRIPALEKLWAKHPDDPELPNLISRAKWDSYGDMEPMAKVEQVKAELRDDPENAVLSKLLGDAYYDVSQEAGKETYLDSALFAYENAALKAPSYLAAVGSVGALYDTREEYDQAIYWYERALTIVPDDVTTLCNIGASHYNKGDYSTAIDYYRKALEIDPESQDAHFNLGVAFAEASIYREAINEWNTVVAIDSTSNVGQQAKQNAKLLSDVLEETRYRAGKRTRQIDMSNARRTMSTQPPGGGGDQAEPETEPETDSPER